VCVFCVFMTIRHFWGCFIEIEKVFCLFSCFIGYSQWRRRDTAVVRLFINYRGSEFVYWLYNATLFQGIRHSLLSSPCCACILVALCVMSIIVIIILNLKRNNLVKFGSWQCFVCLHFLVNTFWTVRRSGVRLWWHAGRTTAGRNTAGMGIITVGLPKNKYDYDRSISYNKHWSIYYNHTCSSVSQQW